MQKRDKRAHAIKLYLCAYVLDIYFYTKLSTDQEREKELKRRTKIRNRGCNLRILWYTFSYVIYAAYK